MGLLHGYSILLIGRTGTSAHPTPGLGPPMTGTYSSNDDYQEDDDWIRSDLEF